MLNHKEKKEKVRELMGKLLVLQVFLLILALFFVESWRILRYMGICWEVMLVLGIASRKWVICTGEQLKESSMY